MKLPHFFVRLELGSFYLQTGTVVDNDDPRDEPPVVIPPPDQVFVGFQPPLVTLAEEDD